MLQKVYVLQKVYIFTKGTWRIDLNKFLYMVKLTKIRIAKSIILSICTYICKLSLNH